jgi:hypothetical protein
MSFLSDRVLVAFVVAVGGIELAFVPDESNAECEIAAVLIRSLLLDNIELRALHLWQIGRSRQRLRGIPERYRCRGPGDLVSPSDRLITGSDLLCGQHSRQVRELVDRTPKRLPYSTGIPNATERDQSRRVRNRRLERHVSGELAVEIERRLPSISHQRREMPSACDERFGTSNRAPAVLTKMCLEFAIRFDREAPLSLIE